MKFFSQLKDYIIRFSKKGLSPKEIASAIAIGIFIGCTPFIGAHTLLAIFIASILRLNTFAVIIGTQISNPISLPFQLFISAEIGSLILNGHFLHLKFSRDIDYFKHYIVPILMGSFFIGITISIMSYFLIKNFLKGRKYKFTL